MRFLKSSWMVFLFLVALGAPPVASQTHIPCISLSDFNALHGYCEDNHCIRCKPEWTSHSLVQIFDGQQSRHMWHSYGGCENFPDGWDAICYELDVRGDYVLTFTMTYEHPYAGAQFRVWFDGQVIGTTIQRGYAWGFPCVDTFGATIGVFPIHVCGGVHHVEVQEITMHLFPYFLAGPASMLAISYGMSLDATRATVANLPSPIQSLGAPASIQATSYPNPSSGVQRIAFRSPEGAVGTPSLEIFNVRGTRVRTFSVPSVAGPDHSVDWNGRDDRGLIVPNGVYFFRVQQGSASFTGRIVRSMGSNGAFALGSGTIAPSPTRVSAQAAPKDRKGTAGGLRPEALFDEGGGGGGGSPTPHSIMQILTAADPFVTVDAQGRPTFDSQTALNAGAVSQGQVELIQKIIGWTRQIIDAGLAGEDWNPDPAMCYFIALNQMPGFIPTYPCLDWDNPFGPPSYQCSGMNFSSEQQARDYLVSQGYHQTHATAFYGRVSAHPIEDDFTKPTTGTYCPTPGSARYNARVVGCGCNWTYYATTSPEPNPELSTYPHSQWYYTALMAYWFLCHGGSRTAPSCCPDF